MTKTELQQLFDLLIKFDRLDFGDMPCFYSGDWSRRNLDGLCDDVEWAIREASTDGQSASKEG